MPPLLSARLQKRIQFEVAPPVLAGSRPTVSAVLHALLTGDQHVARTASHDRALLLGAVWYRLAAGLLGDLSLLPELPPSRRWRREPELGSRRQMLRMCDFVWIGLRPSQIRPVPRLQALLWGLPERLFNSVLSWAPPVVLPADRHGCSRVVANHFSAVLARQRRPAGRLAACPLVRPTVWPALALPELCQAMVQLLWPLYRDHEHRLLGLAHDEAEGTWLTGYARAQYFRNRRRGGVSGRKH